MLVKVDVGRPQVRVRPCADGEEVRGAGLRRVTASTGSLRLLVLRACLEREGRVRHGGGGGIIGHGAGVVGWCGLCAGGGVVAGCRLRGVFGLGWFVLLGLVLGLQCALFV